MQTTINAKTLRARLAEILRRASRGERFSVTYRNRPLCRIVPHEATREPTKHLEKDSLYGAPGVGRSRDGRTSADHDEILYGKQKR